MIFIVFVTTMEFSLRLLSSWFLVDNLGIMHLFLLVLEKELIDFTIVLIHAA